ncbi:Ktr system potassium uptake protein A [Anaerohalosphaera lusitana]|uniref:Ktr system potassium uptake protein A n=1 Tax=Anaerohalosphaera lusitana TaxID=1936003 RepID=A0A1U9NGW7_9BACT|nr:TrkA family potassium uptake protein [Anaerohalosphaera lusitana]AQT67169.1 Ktr system potassium uptake protein A [Anaerohalosphaera lusitana]
MKRYAVIGLGRFGSKLAVSLAMSGAEVIAIDKERNIIDTIQDQVSHAVRLDSTDEDALRAQGINKCDTAIVGMAESGKAFESAVLTVVNLKNLGVPQIIARAQTLTAGQVFTAVGANEVVYPEIETAQRWAYRLLAPHIGEKIDFAPGYSMASVDAPPSFQGKSIMDLQLRQKYNVNLVAIKRSEDETAKKPEKSSIINVPLPDTIVKPGDTLMVAGSESDLAKLPQE